MIILGTAGRLNGFPPSWNWKKKVVALCLWLATGGCLENWIKINHKLYDGSVPSLSLFVPLLFHHHPSFFFSPLITSLSHWHSSLHRHQACQQKNNRNSKVRLPNKDCGIKRIIREQNQQKNITLHEPTNSWVPTNPYSFWHLLPPQSPHTATAIQLSCTRTTSLQLSLQRG